MKGHGREERDFMEIWRMYQQLAYTEFKDASSGAELAKTPKIVLWNNHLTQGEYIDYLVSFCW